MTNGFLDDVATDRIKDFESRFYRFLDSERADVLTTLAAKPELSDEIVTGLRSAATDFKETFTA